MRDASWQAAKGGTYAERWGTGAEGVLTGADHAILARDGVEASVLSWDAADLVRCWCCKWCTVGRGATGCQEGERNDIPTAVAVADYNNDLRPDLAVLNDSSVYLLMSNGDRIFTPASPASIGTRSFGGTAITTGLFNADSFPDVAVSNLDSDNISVFLGNGNGTFKAATLLKVVLDPVVLSPAIGTVTRRLTSPSSTPSSRPT